MSGSGYNGTSVWGYPVDGHGNNCTNYAAYPLRQNGLGNPGNLGNAGDWAANARAKGFLVDHSPAVGAIAQWGYGSAYAPGFGHVAYVEEVTSSGIVETESNWQGPSRRVRINRGDAAWPSAFIHFRDVGGGAAIGEGSFVSVAETGRVYRIAGGAPIYVSSWSAFGGPQPVTQISQAQLNAMPAVPTDGTLLSSTADGRVYRVVGGAPTHVSSWDAIGGARPAVPVDQWAIDNPGDPNAHLRSVPADGTLLSSGGDGRVYVIAGGAPIYVSNWNAIGGSRPATTIDQWAIDNPGDPHSHLNAFPADGTFISSGADGRVYRVVGGAPTYVSNWDAIGGPQAATTIDQWAIDNHTDPHAHLRNLPADNTLISSGADGRVYVIAGGAPIYVSNWDGIGGARPATTIDQWAIDSPGDPHAHLRALPTNGTFISVSQDGRVYRVAGGAPLYLHTWSLFGGAQPTAIVDKWAVDHMSDPHAHLRATPLDGTTLQGLPSGRVWTVSNGHKSRSGSTANAVGVDDQAIAEIPDEQAAATGRVSGQGARSVLARKRTVFRVLGLKRRIPPRATLRLSGRGVEVIGFRRLRSRRVRLRIRVLGTAPAQSRALVVKRHGRLLWKQRNVLRL